MGKTTGKILISYDINKLHTDVKKGMEKKGYSDNFRYGGQNKIYYLPNTTLWHPKKTSDQAISDMKSVCNGFGVTLEKAIAVLATEFVAI